MEKIYTIVDNELYNEIYNKYIDFKKTNPSSCVFDDHTNGVNFNRYGFPYSILKNGLLKTLPSFILNKINNKYDSSIVNYFHLMEAFEQVFKNGILQAKLTQKTFNSRCDGPLTDWPKYITKCLHNKTKFSCKECKFWCVTCRKLVYGFNHQITQSHSIINKND